MDDVADSKAIRLTNTETPSDKSPKKILFTMNVPNLFSSLQFSLERYLYVISFRILLFSMLALSR